jgi:anti-sigma factor RsiW
MTDKPISLDHELLVSYVDGELPRERVADVEAALMRDAAAWETVRLLRLSAQAAARAFEAVMEEPVPERLIAAASAPGVVRRPAIRRWPAAMAASLAALAIGLGTGYFLRTDKSGYVPASLPGGDPLAARFESALASALNGDADHVSYESQGMKGEIILGAEFTTSFGSPCRAFHRDESRADGRHTAGGIACQAADKSWSVMIVPEPAAKAGN